MKLYTRTGDRGDTGLIGGARAPKDHLRVAAYGDVDETNAAIGWAGCAVPPDHALRDHLVRVQDDLFVLGAQLADPDGVSGTPTLGETDIKRLEAWIDAACEAVDPMRNFILPGGSELAARLHMARTIARRAERSAVTLNRSASLGPYALVYLNRLSDLLFAWARWANALAGVADVPWKP